MSSPNASVLRKKLESLLIVRGCAGGGVYGESVFQPVPPASMWILFQSPEVQGLLNQFLDFSQRELLCVQLHIWSVEGGKFRIVLCLHLGDIIPKLSLHSFLWLNNIILHGSTKFCLFIHSLMDIWADSTFWLL